jgi:hypothetical protein
MKRHILIVAAALVGGCSYVDGNQTIFNASIGECGTELAAGVYDYSIAGDKLTITLPMIGSQTFTRLEKGKDFNMLAYNAVWRGATTQMGNIKSTMMVYLGPDEANGLDNAMALMNECNYVEKNDKGEEVVVRGLIARGETEVMITEMGGGGTIELLGDITNANGDPAVVPF